MKEKLTLGLLVIGAIVCIALGACAKKENATDKTTAPGTTNETTEGTTEASEESTKDKTTEVATQPEETQPTTTVTPTDKTHMIIGGLKGPTTMGIVKMIADSEEEKVPYTFSIVVAPDELSTSLVKGEVDIALIPANLAANIYQKTNKEITVLNINTLGVLYFVENGNTIQDINDLKGKTIYMPATGKGSTPELALNYLLAGNDIDLADVTVEYKSESTEIAALLATTEGAIGFLPQPFVTVAQLQNEDIRIALSATDEFEKLDASMVTGVTVVRNAFLKEHPEAVAAFMANHQASVAYLSDDKNLDTTSALIEKYDIVKAAVAKKALPFCNIVCIEGTEMKEKLEIYLASIFEQNPKAIGGAMPEDSFYFVK